MYVPRVLCRHSSSDLAGKVQGPACSHLQDASQEPFILALKCEYMALPCRRAPYRAPPRPYAAATVRAPQPKVKDEKPPGGAFTRDEERPPCRPLPSAACHGALFSPVGSMARR